MDLTDVFVTKVVGSAVAKFISEIVNGTAVQRAAVIAAAKAVEKIFQNAFFVDKKSDNYVYAYHAALAGSIVDFKNTILDRKTRLNDADVALGIALVTNDYMTQIRSALSKNNTFAKLSPARQAFWINAADSFARNLFTTSVKKIRTT